MQRLLESMDTNENGRVDFAEYCHFVLQLVGGRMCCPAPNVPQYGL